MTKPGVVYGLCDDVGNVFYVGQTVSLRRRMASYRSGRFHGNAALAAKVDAFGLNVVVLRECTEGLTKAEFEEIAARGDLVNLIKTEGEALRYAASSKPWVVPGLQLPTTVYMRHMRNAFGQACGRLKKQLVIMTDDERLAVELRFAETFAKTGIGSACGKWVDAINART